MDLVLITITVVSLVLAVTMGAVVFTLLRAERLRSEARVALLVEAAAGPDRVASPGAVDNGPTPAADVHAGGLFAAGEAESPWLRRVGVAVALSAIVAAAGWGFTRGDGPEREDGPVAEAPLELLDLQHAQERGMLTISGVVQNPAGGAPLSGIAVSALLFAPDGSFLTNGRAPLDYVTLAPGDESPFVIRVPVRGTVSRYRVGFRAQDGSVVAHVDRRSGGASARNVPVQGSSPWTR